MKRIYLIAGVSLLIALIAGACCGSKYSYESVKGDPLKTRIYTLDNGLKVYMAVNKEEPRIQTFIAVKVGGKNDPAETTGLAHYFEHLMFKGTQQYGTTDYEKEKPMLDEIERLFEQYRSTDDEAERKAIYHRIDSISYEASKLAIPNEYDKLMAAIGAEGTNAFTSYDVTAYMEDIPSNQIENWARIQADRFKNVVIRGFHTELETIYEEKNMSLTNDARKVNETLTAALFPNHPYGTQTVLGTQEHLKNPSITNVKNYHKTYYVPNNMAVCLSGDFDPDEMIAVIDRYFGDMQPNENLPELAFDPEEPITAPIEREVLGLDAQNVTIGWRLDGAASDDNDLAQLAGSILHNGEAGLFDLNLNQQQKVLSAYAYPSMRTDYGCMVMNGRPKAGQTLEQVRDLMLAEVAKLRAGDFDEALLKATVDNYKVQIMRMSDSNYGRAYQLLAAFYNGEEWEREVAFLDRLSKVTKEDIVRFANEKLGENNYAVVYKREGKDPNELKMTKPQITPIVTNRDAVSPFLAEVQASEVQPIEPLFLDFEKDMTRTTGKSDIEVLYKKNDVNGLFTLIYVFETGLNGDPALGIARTYLDYLGTADMTPEQIKAEMYGIACSQSINIGSNRSYIIFRGLNENMGRAMELFEGRVAGAQPDEAVLETLKADLRKARADAKLNQGSNFNALVRYAQYGPEMIRATTLTDKELQTLTSEQLLSKLRELMGKQHTILYYGPASEQELLAQIEEHHNVPDRLEPIEKKHLKYVETPESRVLLAEYDAKQLYFVQYSNLGEKFDPANDAQINLYNEYFGGGMNSIVFQEMREARGLAYAAQAYIMQPGYEVDPYAYIAFIATQNDKMGDAIDAFDEIINQMPESEAAFKIAKESYLTRLRTQRTVKENVLFSWLDAQDMGVDYDRDKAVYERVGQMTLEDVKAAQQKWVKDRNYCYAILGDSKDLDLNKLRKLGPITFLSQEELFGY